MTDKMDNGQLPMKTNSNSGVTVYNSSDSNFPKVAIIILNWNGWQDTIECLESLQRITYPNFYVVIVDNASTDSSVEKIGAWLKGNGLPLAEYRLESRDELPVPLWVEEPLKEGLCRVELIASKINLGFCAGNNVGMEFAYRAGADYFLILNNDTLVEPTFLQPLVEIAELSDDVGLVGGLICYAESPETICWAGDVFDTFLETKRMLTGYSINKVQSDESFEVDCILGCMTLIPRTIFEIVGGYDESFFIMSEDWDLSLRVSQSGKRLLVVPQSKIYHKVSKSLGVLKPLSYYYGTRNRLLLKRKHLQPTLRFLFLLWFLPSRLVRYGIFAVKGRLDLVSAGCCAIRDYFLGRTGKWSKHEG